MAEKENNKCKKIEFNVNENEEIYIRTFDDEYKKEINIYFDKEDNTNVIDCLIDELIKEYVQSIMKR